MGKLKDYQERNRQRVLEGSGAAIEDLSTGDKIKLLPFRKGVCKVVAKNKDKVATVKGPRGGYLSVKYSDSRFGAPITAMVDGYDPHPVRVIKRVEA